MLVLYVVVFFFIYLAWIRRNDKGPRIWKWTQEVSVPEKQRVPRW